MLTLSSPFLIRLACFSSRWLHGNKGSNFYLIFYGWSVLILVHDSLPLDTVMIFISDVIQKVEDMQRHRTFPSTEVIKFLSSVNLDHIIPSKPAITARRFMVYVKLKIYSFYSNPIFSGRMRHWCGLRPSFGAKSTFAACRLWEFGILQTFAYSLWNIRRTNRGRSRKL